MDRKASERPDGSARGTRRRGMPVPRLLVFLGLNAGLGFMLGVVFAAVVILTNVAGLKGLLDASDSPYVALVMLYVMCGLTFASLVTGVAVMSLPRDEPDQ